MATTWPPSSHGDGQALDRGEIRGRHAAAYIQRYAEEANRIYGETISAPSGATYAWMVVLGRHGMINEGLMALGVIEQPLQLLNTTLATEIA